MSEFAGYEIEVPFGPAAGVLNGANEEVLTKQIFDCLRSPAAAVWFGSLTFKGGAGNEPEYGVVYYHNTLTHQTVNSMGLPNIGYKRGVAIYPELKKAADAHNKPLIPSLSPGKDEDPLSVLPVMAEGFVDAGAGAIEVNYSCPNKITDGGGREPVLGNDLETMESIDQEIVRRIGPEIYIIRKLPPYVGDKQTLIPAVGEIFERAAGRKILNLSNTIGGQSILNEDGAPALKVPGNLGGLSGPATARVGENQLKQFQTHLSEGVSFVSGLGIMHGRDVYKRIHVLGAAMTNGATVYIENETHGKSYGQTSQQIAEEYAEVLEASVA